MSLAALAELTGTVDVNGAIIDDLELVLKTSWETDLYDAYFHG